MPGRVGTQPPAGRAALNKRLALRLAARAAASAPATDACREPEGAARTLAFRGALTVEAVVRHVRGVHGRVRGHDARLGGVAHLRAVTAFCARSLRAAEPRAPTAYRRPPAARGAAVAAGAAHLARPRQREEEEDDGRDDRNDAHLRWCARDLATSVRCLCVLLVPGCSPSASDLSLHRSCPGALAEAEAGRRRERGKTCLCAPRPGRSLPCLYGRRDPPRLTPSLQEARSAPLRSGSHTTPRTLPASLRAPGAPAARAARSPRGSSPT